MFLFAGCERGAAPTAGQQVEASSLPKITVNAKAKLLLTYATAGREFKTVGKLEQVPASQRGWVRVVDLNIKPDRRKDHQLVYVADLRSARKDGSYPYVVLSRAAFESAAAGRSANGVSGGPPAGGAPVTGGKVILYATSWCGACRSARQYLQAKGIPYVEKDIEKDEQAAAELLQKAKAAGISASGVPVLDVGGTLVQGFDAARIEALLARAKPATRTKKP